MCSDTAWQALWLPLLLTIAKHTVNGSHDIRQRAIGYLQRVLFNANLLERTNQHVAIQLIFSRVLFPVMDQLLKPQQGGAGQDPVHVNAGVGGGGNNNIEETRLRASALVSKAFLQYLAPLSERPDALLEVLLKIVGLLERSMRTGSRQQVSVDP